MKKLPIVAVFAAVLLTACGGGDVARVGKTDNGFTIEGGIAQKGPMAAGSNVSIDEIISSTFASAGSSYHLQTTGDLGSFDTSALRLSRQFIKTYVAGYYRNELTGELANDQVTLMAYSDLDSDRLVNVNLLTTLASARIEKLVQDKTNAATYRKFGAARAQAQKEVLAAFGIYNVSDLLPGGVDSTQGILPANFNELDLSKSQTGSAVLAALSAVAVKAGGNGAGINEFIADFQADLADNGVIDSAVRRQIDTASATPKMMDVVAVNLKKFFPSTTVTAAQLSPWIDSSGGADQVIDKFKSSASNVTVGTLSKSPAYVTGSEDVGRCIALGSVTSGAVGALYAGSATTPSTVIKVLAKGDSYYIGLTATTTGTVSGFIQRFAPGPKGVCPTSGSVNGVTQLYKYSLINTLPAAITRRSLGADFSTRKAVSYSPFRTINRNTEVITDANVLQDLTLLSQGGFKLIRLFDSSDDVSKRILRLLNSNPGLDIKVMLGAYMLSESSPYITDAQRAASRSFNQAEIARAAALANAYPSIVAAVSVGNETMVSWSFVPNTPAAMADYISTLRGQITQPVTTDDNWAFFARANGEPNDPKAVLNVVDFVAVHTYPLADSQYNTWDWKQSSAVAMMDAAIAKAKAEISAVRSNLDGLGFSGLPIVIGETGWKAKITNGETFRAHPANQRMYFERLAAWAGSAGAPKAIFYFEAFDEPWKLGDDGWGLFNVARQPRCVVKELYPNLAAETSSCSDAQALYYIAPTSGDLITASRYTVFADAIVAGEARPTEVTTPFPWNGNTAEFTQSVSVAEPGDGGVGLLITPKPSTWGWGLALGLANSTANLSNFNASNGRLNFSINTSYKGKLEIGFFTGSALANSGYDAYLPIASGNYGYVNDGNWHQVSIPMSAITAKGAPAYGMPVSAQLDMTKVQGLLVIADRYAVTGNSASTTPIKIDAIYWSK